MFLYQVPVPLDIVNKVLPALGLILVLGVAWLVIRFIFKIATRIFMLGCVAIVFIGTLIAAANAVIR